MKEDKEGRTVRIDHWTGDVTIIAGDRMIKAKTQQEQEAEEKKQAASVAALAAPKYFPPITLGLGGGMATLETSWRNGTMFYQFSLTPVSKRVEQARNLYTNSICLMFYDTAGFKIKQITIRLSSMTGNVDDAGKVNGLSMDDSDDNVRYFSHI